MPVYVVLLCSDPGGCLTQILEPLLETGNLYSGAKVVLRVAYEDPRNGEHHGQHHAGAVARGHSHTAPDFARYVDAPVWRGGSAPLSPPRPATAV